jgi:hypothetical protein
MSSNTTRLCMRLTAVALIVGMSTRGAVAAQTRTVIELFTSQGCSSCPPADAVVGRLSNNPAVLVLSFHVNYWDSLGWKDPFSSVLSTDRQYAYARSLNERSVFTPQLIVNGMQSMVGSQEGKVQMAVAAASQTSFPVRAELSEQVDGRFSLTLTGTAVSADLWEVRYVRHSATPVRSGENGGRTLETFNDVTQLRRIGAFRPGTFTLEALKKPDDGIAVFVQGPGAGRIWGAASN